MRDSPWYIVFLLVVVGGAMGSIYFGADVETVQVVGKRTEEGRSRYGMSSTSYVLQTDRGRLPLLKLPIVGYAFGAEDVYERVRVGSSIQVRIGYWPPRMFSDYPKRYVIAVY